MTDLTLLVKASNPKQLRQIDDFLKAELGELDLEIKVSISSINKWVQVSLSGEDQAIATNYINQKIGTCPVTTENIKKDTVLKGYLLKIDTTKQQLRFDIGVFQPKIVQATIPLTYLQTQLANGKKTPINQICEIYGLREGLPLSIKISNIEGEEEGFLPAEFSLEQIEQITFWKRSLLDRLIILNASQSEVDTVLARTGLNRDIIGVDALGMFEYALVCKLGTDAAGLVSGVGRYMRNAVFIVYNPRRIIDLIGETSLNL